MTYPCHKVGRAADIPPGTMTAADLPGGRRIAIYNVDGRYYATDDLCTHGKASLSEEGMLEGGIIECGLHLGTFDVTTGAAVGAPCGKALQTYPVGAEAGEGWVDDTQAVGRADIASSADIGNGVDTAATTATAHASIAKPA